MPAAKKPKAADPADPFQPRADSAQATDREVHVFGKKVVCDTDTRGFPTPHNRSPLDIVLDASDGFIPLWAEGTTLRWRFQERSLRRFARPAAAKTAIKRLLGEAVAAWGDAAPVRFTESSDNWDFEIAVRESDRCDVNGCVLASAFFPDPGRHELRIYPILFSQPREEQVGTMAHEIGHVFGLRHFFANVSETTWPSQVFGTHDRFTIMNYGSDSVLTDADRDDLRALYKAARAGTLTQINGTPIRLVQPFHMLAARRPR